MKRIEILVACGALSLLGLVGCDDGRGSDDAGGIMLMDSGGREDAGRRDAGTPAAMCSLAGAAGIPPLPAGCLPRCSNATVSCIQGCGSRPEAERPACQDACIEADMTDAENLDVGGAMPIEIDCGGCISWQINACVYATCPDQVGACLNCMDGCNPMTAGCETEEGALNSCLYPSGDGMTLDPAIESCIPMNAGMCFGA